MPPGNSGQRGIGQVQRRVSVCEEMKSRLIVTVLVLGMALGILAVFWMLPNPRRGISATQNDVPPGPLLMAKMRTHVIRELNCSPSSPTGTASPLVMWGDSLTDGTGMTHPNGKTALEVARQVLGDQREIINQGMGGNLAKAVAARAGAYVISVSIPALKIPGQPQPIEVIPNIPLLDGGGTLQLAVEIAGVSGVLVRQNQPVLLPYTFTRASGGTEVKVPGSVPLHLKDNVLPEAVQIFWVGTNDAWQSGRGGVPRVVDAIRAVVREMGSRRFLILTLPPGGYRPHAFYLQGNGFSPAVIEINQYLRGEYAQDTVDVFKILTTFDGNKNGTVPASLRSDDIHLNASGYYLVGLALARAIQCRGW